MATHFITFSSRATLPPPNSAALRYPFPLFTIAPPHPPHFCIKNHSGVITRAASNGENYSYLDMWKKAMDNEKKGIEFQKISETSVEGYVEEESEEVVKRKNIEFQKILEVSKEERDRVQRMQVIDRAAAAIAAARSLLEENNLPGKAAEDQDFELKNGGILEDQLEGTQDGRPFVPSSGTSIVVTPGPNFWSWTPPNNNDAFNGNPMKSAMQKSSPSAATDIPVIEKDRSLDFLPIPFQSKIFQSKSSLPPLQSHVEVEQEASSSSLESSHLDDEHELGVQFSTHAAQAAEALDNATGSSTQGVTLDGSRWWKETGVEQRPDGVICKWTLTRGITPNQTIEWEEKYWEASDELGYKELGSEKSGRDAAGNVWREYWRESMSQAQAFFTKVLLYCFAQNGGLVNLEKTADKWGRNTKGEEWQEKWWEHYGASGKAEKWAHKWCSVDPYTPLDVGHAHVWHERWGEKYDGHGGSTKYTDKWAERFEGDGWSKWGDKWDENFNPNAQGMKQGETWWHGKYGDRWNRTWGEGHNGSGWVHKYGRSSDGEHWDTHEQQDTWYEKYPHYGFYHCFDNSVQLRQVKKPSEWS
ncbi:hypothetical protein Leryth_014009 [Lithospermum erythrorhizon]|nr:hypothetical protein Leryth_014009 [Lithospermum erythrorhizon]